MLKRILLSDKDVVRRIKQNDRSVLGEIYHAYQRMIFKYVINHGGRTEDAEDIVNDTIIILWQNVNNNSFELSSKISTYLFAIAKNLWRTESRKKRKMIELEDGTPEITVENKILENISYNETHYQLDIALQKLGAPCKEILLYYYFEERSMQNIAEIMGFANSDVVKAKKYQCKKQLEKLLFKGKKETRNNKLQIIIDKITEMKE